jgi:hypothetical protein
MLGCELNSTGSGLGKMADSCEHANESLGSIKSGELRLDKRLLSYEVSI